MREAGRTQEQEALASTIDDVCAGLAPTAHQLPGDVEGFPVDGWRTMAELGVLGIGSVEGGGPTDVLVAMEALGRGVFPGPLIDTVLACQVLDGPARDAVAGGAEVASVGRGRHFPWGNEARWLLSIEGAEVAVFERQDPGAVVRSMAGEPWAIPEATPVGRYDLSDRALVLADLALAGYLLGAATTCLRVTAEHARSRRQFGKSLGEFQAVAYALARLDAGVATAEDATWQCAWSCEHDGLAPTRSVLACAGAARAAVDAVLVCHQVFGAMGFSAETGLWRLSTRVRQLSLSPLLTGRRADAVVQEARALVAGGSAWRGR